jgi:peroxiredoxin
MDMNHFLVSFIIIPVILFPGCSRFTPKNPIREGSWRGEITLQGQRLPFIFNIRDDSSGQQILTLLNGEEKLVAGEIAIQNDSVFFPMHIFDTHMISKATNDRLEGYWIKNYFNDYILPFRADAGKTYRFSENPHNPSFNITGKWEAIFSSENDTTRAVGIFEQENNQLKGTFLTTSGDYRYLAGEVDGDSMRLSTFDGEHAFLFKARIDNDHSMTGMYWSGKSWNQPWVAIKNPGAKLPDEDSLVFLKPGYTKVDFKFPGLDGNPVSPDDDQYKGKVLILQIYGTWCPNCMDETMFLAEWYRKNHEKGVEIIGLAFERKDDFSYASNRLIKMKKALSVDYDFVIAGKSGAGNAAKALPMLTGEISFPTTIFIDRSGRVRKIHSGFSGPGTGVYYERYIEDFNAFMRILITE